MDYIQHSLLDDHLNDSLELHHDSCFFCGGFYGPCFGEPVCGTCHDFLFTEDFELFHVVARSSFSEKDDGDSGNDEPSEEAVQSNRVADHGLPNPPENVVEEAIDDVVNDNLDPGNFPIPIVPIEDADQPLQIQPPWPQQQDKMTNRLLLLTTPWPQHESKILTDDMSLRVPPEIWAIIFKKLDDVSLLMASKVNPKWKAIVTDQICNNKWEEFIRARWPLFHPIYPVSDWYSVYSDLVDSVPCKLCFMNLTAKLPNIDHTVRSLRSVRLHKELKWLRLDHPEGIEAVPLDKLNYNWLARVNGPPQSPYQGGVFYLNLKVPHDYPLKPPMVRFLTKIFHPNISRHGDIGIDCIQHNWTLALTIPQILLSVQSLLTDPFLETNMEASISNLYSKDKQTFDKVARIWTWKYAMHDVLIH